MHLRVGKTAELVTCILLQVKQKPAAALLCARPTQRPQGWGEEWLGFLLLPSPLIIITTLKGRQWGLPFRLGETEALSWLRSHSQKPSAGRGSVCKRNPLDRAPSSAPELPQALRPFSPSRAWEPESQLSGTRRSMNPNSGLPVKSVDRVPCLLFLCLVCKSFDFFQEFLDGDLHPPSLPAGSMPP